MSEDAISRQAALDKLLKLCNELETIFSDIREKNVDDSVCGLCEYDCDHGIDGSAFECPGFERDDCFKLKDEIRKEWSDLRDLPSVHAEPCSDVISRQAVLDVIHESKANFKNEFDQGFFVDKIKDLPSVHAEPKTGHLIKISECPSLIHRFECSACGCCHCALYARPAARRWRKRHEQDNKIRNPHLPNPQ